MSWFTLFIWGIHTLRNCCHCLTESVGITVLFDLFANTLVNIVIIVIIVNIVIIVIIVIYVNIVIILLAFLMTGIVNVNITTLERRYQLSTSEVAWIPVTYDLVAGVSALVCGYLGVFLHNGGIMTFSAGAMALGSFIMMLPHWLGGIYEEGLDVPLLCEIGGKWTVFGVTGTLFVLFVEHLNLIDSSMHFNRKWNYLPRRRFQLHGSLPTWSSILWCRRRCTLGAGLPLLRL